MAVALITGCGKKEAIPLFTDGEANFIIVRSADADNETINAAADLRQTIADNLGITVNHKPDSIAHKDGQLEVNIGIINRPDSQAVYGEVSNETETYGLDYIIKPGPYYCDFNSFMQIIISQGALDSGGATKANETSGW